MWEGSHLGFPCGSHDPGGNLFSWLKWGARIPMGSGVAMEEAVAALPATPASLALAAADIEACLALCRAVTPAPLPLPDHHPFKIQSVGVLVQ